LRVALSKGHWRYAKKYKILIKSLFSYIIKILMTFTLLDEKNLLAKRDICTKFITPAILEAGWYLYTQIREKLNFLRYRIIVRDKLHSCGKQKCVDYVLSFKPCIPIAVIEARENNLCVDAGMQQVSDYAEILEAPFVFSSNSDAFFNT